MKKSNKDLKRQVVGDIKLSNYDTLSEDTNKIKKGGSYYLVRPVGNKYEYIKIYYTGGLEWKPWEYEHKANKTYNFDTDKLIDNDSRIFTVGNFLKFTGIEENIYNDDFYHGIFDENNNKFQKLFDFPTVKITYID